MINELRIQNGIKYTDKTFNFEKGLTVIHGANGKGKSLIQEFIRFALFGSSALRGKVSDYPVDMKITLTLSDGIKIERTIKSCLISDNNGLKVTGTTACNEWVVSRLGYGLDVFDMGNCAKQMEIAKLGRMKPSERKQAINRVIGISAIDAVIKKLRDERRDLNNHLDGLREGMTKPEEPVKPEDYKPSPEYNDEVREAVRIKAEFDNAMPAVDEPLWEGDIPAGLDKNESVYLYLKYDKDRYTGAEKPKYETAAEVDAIYKAGLQWKNWEEPSLSESDCEQIKGDWEYYERWEKADKVTCPECGHQFVPNFPEPYKPDVDYETARKSLWMWRKKPSLPKPDHIMSDSEKGEELAKIEAWNKLQEAESKLKEFEGIDWDAVHAYQNYKDEKEHYERYKEQQSRLSKLHHYTDEEIRAMQDKAGECAAYESLLRKYEREKKAYDDKQAKCDEIQEKITEYEKGIDGLMAFESAIKNSLIPSLSRVASNLVSEFTGRQFGRIEIDGDFSILADGKEISLLSGGEEAVVNLAIRLALSSVLTRRSFNSFIGDEIDQSMDRERAQNTNYTLKKLTPSPIEQIILISHKPLDCDHEIILE